MARDSTATGMRARHAAGRRRSGAGRVLGALGLVLTFVLSTVLGTAGLSAAFLVGSLDTVEINEAGTEDPLPEFENSSGAFNVLLVGSDTREGQEATNDGHEGEPLNDVTMLLHVNENHDAATVISLPRDLLVDFPTCYDGETELEPLYGAQFNDALAHGGLRCVVDTVESLTDLPIQYAAMITFDGVINMSTAVGGVPVCFAGPVIDPWSGLQIPAAGTYELEGEQALQFLRTRHGVGDGSDLARLASQRVFMSSLIRKLQSDDVLGNPASLYRIAQVATRNMTLSTSLNDPGTMVGMANVLRRIPLDKMQFVTFPTQPYGDRLLPDEYVADIMFDLIRADEPLPLDPSTLGAGSSEKDDVTSEEPSDGEEGQLTEEGAEEVTEEAEPTAEEAQSEESAQPTPTGDAELIDGFVQGQSADQETCVVPYGF